MPQAKGHTRRSLEDFAEIASDWFWETDADHCFVFLSARVEEVLQVPRSIIIGTRRDSLTPERIDNEKWEAHLADLANLRPFRNFEYSFTRPKDGALLWLRVSGQPYFAEDGSFQGYRGVGADITGERSAIAILKETNAALAARNEELKDMRRALERSEHEDNLTGMLNRFAFETDLSEALLHSNALLVLLHIDIDRFKWINDSLGHTAGDNVLIATAERIRQVASGLGPVYRVGGNEFMVVLAEDATIERARWIGDTIVETMQEPIRVEAQKISLSVSIGIASGEGGQFSAHDLITHADIALSFAKQEGRGTVREVTENLLTDIAAKRQLASDLPEAIANGQIVPFFQPQIAAETGCIVGAEALARWQHPDLGLLAPAAFLSIASDLGLLPAIDKSMLQQALAFVHRAKRDGVLLPSVSVNLSAGRLMDPQLANDIEIFWTDRTCRLSIELLETISLDDFNQDVMVKDNLRRLRELGVKIETDDFGSARASITSLLN
ncbi:MAG: diguanylate cyclase [Pseudomonadota bacterium]